MPYQRYENPKAVDVEIDADGWPTVVIFTAEGGADRLIVRPKGNAEILTYKPDPNPIWSGKREYCECSRPRIETNERGSFCLNCGSKISPD